MTWFQWVLIQSSFLGRPASRPEETHGKTTLMTELPRGGEVSWLQNPRSLEDRNSLAKLLFQADCKDPMGWCRGPSIFWVYLFHMEGTEVGGDQL